MKGRKRQKNTAGSSRKEQTQSALDESAPATGGEVGSQHGQGLPSEITGGEFTPPESPSTAKRHGLLKYKLDQQFADETDPVHGPKSPLTIIVHRPKLGWHFHAHPDPNMSAVFYVLEHPLDKHLYLLIDRALNNPAAALAAKPRQLHPCVTSLRLIFIWPVPLPRTADPDSSMATSAALSIINMARKGWFTAQWDSARMCYVGESVTNAEQYDPREICPEFFEMDYETLLYRAFENRIIETEDDPILLALSDWEHHKKLRGSKS